jgi:uncharacterized damage-inducible protein DinB
MTPAALLTDALDRVRQVALAAVDGLDDDQLAHRPTGADGARGNSIAWLVWHLARVQDDHVADVAGHEQAWTAEGFAERFALGFDTSDIGYGHSSDDVDRVRLSAADLAAYVEAVHARSTTWVAGLEPDDLDRVVDEHWDPPVTLGVRLVSLLADDLQHAGQAAYVRGLLGA